MKPITAAILYYRHVLRVQHVAVLRTNYTYGNSFVDDGLIDAATTLAPDVKLASVAIPFDLTKTASDTLLRIVAELKATGLVSFLIPYTTML